MEWIFWYENLRSFGICAAIIFKASTRCWYAQIGKLSFHVTGQVCFYIIVIFSSAAIVYIWGLSGKYLYFSYYIAEYFQNSLHISVSVSILPTICLSVCLSIICLSIISLFQFITLLIHSSITFPKYLKTGLKVFFII